MPLNTTLHVSAVQPMRRVFYIIFVFICSLSNASTLDDLAKKKVEFLKSELLDSNCNFERNGKTYSAEKAVEHINKKQEYYSDKIDSVEKFIELTASKSTMSGKSYFIHCDGALKIESAVWLKKKVEQYGAAK